TKRQSRSDRCMVPEPPGGFAEIVPQGPASGYGCAHVRYVDGRRAGGILLRAMESATLSCTAIRRGGNAEGRRAKQGGKTAHQAEAHARVAAAFGRAR